MPPARSASKKEASRRPRGTVSLLIRRDLSGGEIWYGKWRAGDDQIKRRIGRKHDVATGEGLTRTEAEAQLRALMGTVRLQGNGGGRVTVGEAGQLLLERLETKGRRRTTLESYGNDRAPPDGTCAQRRFRVDRDGGVTCARAVCSLRFPGAMERDHCDVVSRDPRTDQFAQHSVADFLGFIGADGAPQPLEACIDDLAATLDEPVRVEGHHRPFGQRNLRAGSRSVCACAEWRVNPQVREDTERPAQR